MGVNVRIRWDIYISMSTLQNVQAYGRPQKKSSRSVHVGLALNALTVAVSTQSLVRLIFYTVITSSVARLFNVHEETVRSIAMYVRR